MAVSWRRSGRRSARRSRSLARSTVMLSSPTKWPGTQPRWCRTKPTRTSTSQKLVRIPPLLDVAWRTGEAQSSRFMSARPRQGAKAAEILLSAMLGERQPVQAVVRLPMVFADCGTNVGELKRIFSDFEAAERSDSRVRPAV